MNVEVGEVLGVDGNLYVVVEVGEKVVVTFPCTPDGAGLLADEKKEWTLSELQGCKISRKGKWNNIQMEPLKRRLIGERVSDFYQRFHKRSPWVPGETPIQYAGKVYDEQEMVSLVDAALDFWLTSGRYARTLEKELAQFLGVKFVLLTNSGSSANLLAVSALTSPLLGEKRLRPGDEVITAAAGFPTTVAPIIQNGLIPVFVDVELGTYNVDVSKMEQAITSKTKAIMLAHTMGNPFDLDAVMRLASQHDLWVIEDNCDALGSRFVGRPTGSFGHIGTSSFYPPHHITTGEGGAVYTSDPLIKRALESLRDWGRDCWCPSGRDNTCRKRFGWKLGSLPYGYDHKYIYTHLGYNLKMTDLQAAIGIEQLKKLNSFTSARVRNFRYIQNRLKEIEDRIILPKATPNSEPSWFGFVITIRDGMRNPRQQVIEYLERHRIQTRMLFAGNLVKQPAFQHVTYRVAGNLDNTDTIMNNTFVVGVYPGLDERQTEYIAAKVIEAFS